MDLQLTGKVALVTGSSKGIGEAVASGLALEGATVIVHGRDAGETERVSQEIVAAGGHAHAVVGDLTSDGDVETMLAEVRAMAGEVDILVNNAGGSGVGEDWDHASPATWASTYDRNVLTAVRITTELLPGMRAKQWGRIVNISSMAALMPPPVNPDYSTAKAAMLAMTVSLAKAVAAEGITVNTITPGTIRSARLEAKFREVAAAQGIASGASWEEVERAVLPRFAQIPLGRVGTLQEIADVISFLVSPRAGYITGSNIRLDGGMLSSL